MVKQQPLPVGSVFQRLTVGAHTGYATSPSGTRRRLYVCTCECGGTVTVRENLLKNGNTGSCGCLHQDRTSAATRVHGQTVENGPGKKSAYYLNWLAMRSRCENPNDKDYPGWGGRGVKVCNEWKDFVRFESDMGPRPIGMQIDRIDNDGDYSSQNCRWATPTEQARNRRSTFFVEYLGTSKPLAEWAEIVGISRNTLYQRIKNSGWPIERALTQGANRAR